MSKVKSYTVTITEEEMGLITSALMEYGKRDKFLQEHYANEIEQAQNHLWRELIQRSKINYEE